MDIFCSNCGAKLSGNTKFCSSCGRIQTGAQPVQPAKVQPAQAVQQTSKVQPVPKVQPVQPVQHAPKVQPTQPAPKFQPTPEPQYTPEAYQQSPVPPKKKSKLPLILALSGTGVVVIAVAIILIVTSVLGTLKETAALDYFKIGNDEVPTVKLVLSEDRTVTGVSRSSSSDGTKKQAIVYAAKADVDTKLDMLRYATTLCEDYGFYSINDNDFSGETGTDFRFAKESVDKDNLIIVRIDYNKSSYTITLIRGEGTMTYPSYVGLWRVEDEDEIVFFYLKAGGEFRSEGHFDDGTSFWITGKYKVSGGYLIMSNILYDGVAEEDTTFTISISGNTAIINTITFFRVPDHKVADVLANPTAPYTP